MDKALPLLRQGVAAARAGDRARAYLLLKQTVELDPDNEMGWLWLAGVCNNPQEASSYLERVLRIDPFNERALSGWKWVQEKIREDGDGRAENRVEGWPCPACLSRLPAPMNKCPECKSILTLSDLGGLLTNASVNRARVLEAIATRELTPEADGDFGAHYNLVIAHLNVRQVHEAIVHLREAVSLRPGDRALQARLEDLSLRWAEHEIAPGGGQGCGSVLVVDDSPTIRKLVEVTLEKKGFHVLTASDGLEALATIHEGLPALILLDITMPRMDGYQLCKTLKSTAATKDIPVIMLSGKDGLFDKARGRMAGSSGYITKPFNPDDLVRFVADQIRHGRRPKPTA